MVSEMLQKPKCLLYVLSLFYLKFYFDYKFNIYVICFIIRLLDIYMYIIRFSNLLHIFILILFDFEFL